MEMADRTLQIKTLEVNSEGPNAGPLALLLYNYPKLHILPADPSSCQHNAPRKPQIYHSRDCGTLAVQLEIIGDRLGGKCFDSI
jgi:hypothetical protein